MIDHKELTITIQNVLDSDKEFIINEISKKIKSSNIEYTLRDMPKRWPKMKLGDRFKYNDTRFIFICYMDNDHKKARAVEEKSLCNDATVGFNYFSTEDSNKIAFE